MDINKSIVVFLLSIITLSCAQSVTLDIGGVANFTVSGQSILNFEIEVPIVNGFTRPLVVSALSTHDPYAQSFTLNAYKSSLGALNFTSFNDRLDITNYQVLYVPEFSVGSQDANDTVTIYFTLNNNYLFGSTIYSIDPEVIDAFGALTTQYSSVIRKKINLSGNQRAWFSFDVNQVVSDIKLIVENCDSLNGYFDQLKWFNLLESASNVYGGNSLSTTCNWGVIPAGSVQTVSISPVGRILVKNLSFKRYFFSVTSSNGGTFQIKFLYNVANDQTQLNPGVIRVGNSLGLTGVPIADSYDLYAIDYNSFGDTCYLETHSSDKRVSIIPEKDVLTSSGVWNVDYNNFYKGKTSKEIDNLFVSLVVNQPDNGFDGLGMCSVQVPVLKTSLTSDNWPGDAIAVSASLGACLFVAIAVAVALLIHRARSFRYTRINQ